MSSRKDLPPLDNLFELRTVIYPDSGYAYIHFLTLVDSNGRKVPYEESLLNSERIKIGDDSDTSGYEFMMDEPVITRLKEKGYTYYQILRWILRSMANIQMAS